MVCALEAGRASTLAKGAAVTGGAAVVDSAVRPPLDHGLLASEYLLSERRRRAFDEVADGVVYFFRRLVMRFVRSTK